MEQDLINAVSSGSLLVVIAILGSKLLSSISQLTPYLIRLIEEFTETLKAITKFLNND
jgi:hypothetical protein